jgi:streptogramin lyase
MKTQTSRSLLTVIAAVVALMLPQPWLSAADGPFEPVAAWPEQLDSLPMGYPSWVDVDANGTVYLFRRCAMACSNAPHPGPSDPPGSVLLYDANGKYLREWEPKLGGKWKEAHGLQIDRRGFIWTTDVMLHTVKKYSADGALLMTLGKEGVAGETKDTFNKPTNVVVAADDSIYVSDGYGNQRVVKFSKDGKFIKAWGKQGTGPGEFRIPHGIAQDRSGRIIVADRCGLGASGCTDGRIQVFDPEGRYLAQWKPPSGVLVPHAVAVDEADRLYVDDAQNDKIWILDAKTLTVIETIEGLSGHGMNISPSGDDIYVTGSLAGVRRYSRRR